PVFINMPAPPPKGLSSTVRCLSCAKSLGLQHATSIKPERQALPVTPYDVTAVNISGNSVTIPTCIRPTCTWPADMRASPDKFLKRLSDLYCQPIMVSDQII